MNQILITKTKYNIYDNITKTKKINKKIYLFIFYLSIIFCIVIVFYLLYSNFSKLTKQKQSNIIKDKYNVTTLYSSNNYYTILKLSNDIKIIGLIEIPSIDISYPILFNCNEDLLKISVCRFSGPLPNRNGNLCIAGHNYKNNTMFSNLYKVNIHDSIFITDLNNVRLEYVIYKKNKVKENNLECIKNTNNCEITLITCNNYNNTERIILKAKVKE